MASKTPAPAPVGPVGHTGGPEYSTLAQAAAAAPLLLSKIRGEDVPLSELLHCGWVVQGFVQSMASPHRPPVMGTADAAKAEELGAELFAACNTRQGDTAAVGAFSWLTLLKILREILINLS